MFKGYMKKVSLHFSGSGWWYGYDNKSKMYTGMYESEVDLREEIDNGIAKWYTKDDFFRCASQSFN